MQGATPETTNSDHSTQDALQAPASLPPRRALRTRLLIGTPLLLGVLGLFTLDYLSELAAETPWGLTNPVIVGVGCLVLLVAILAAIEFAAMLRRVGWPVHRGMAVGGVVLLVGTAWALGSYAAAQVVQRIGLEAELSWQGPASIDATAQSNEPKAVAEEQRLVTQAYAAQAGVERLAQLAPKVLFPLWFAWMLGVWAIALWSNGPTAHRDRWSAAVGTSFIVTLVGGAFALGLLLRAVPSAGFALLLLALLASRLGDAGAYFAGRFTGRIKLIPNVSPKKTVEGFVGGLVTSGLIGLGLAVAFPVLTAWFAWPWWIVIGVAIGLAAQLADLLASAAKRAAEVKDSSNLIPEFGGVVDLVDGFLFSIPMLVAALLALPYVLRAAAALGIFA